MIQIQVKGTIQLTDDVAEVLEHITSYDLCQAFENKYSKKYDKDTMYKVLQPLRSELHKILAARTAAIKAANEVLSPRKKQEDGT